MKFYKSTQKYRNLAIIIAFILLSTLFAVFWINNRAAAAESIPSTDLLVFRLDRDTSSWQPIFLTYPKVQADYLAISQLLEQGKVDFTPDKAFWRITSTGNNTYGLALSTPYHSRSLPKAWESFILEKASFQGVDIYQLQTGQNQSLAVARYKGLLLAGQLPLQIESAITQLKKGKSKHLPPVADREIYFNVENLDIAKGAPLLTHQYAALRHWQEYFSGIKWEFSAQGDSIELTGKILGAMNTTAPIDQTEEAFAYLPEPLKWCYSWNAVDTSKNTDFSHYLSPYLDGQAYSLSLAGQTNQLHLFKLNDSPAMELSIVNMADELGAIASYNYQLFTVYPLLSERLLQPLGIQIRNPHLVVVDDYLLIGSQRSEIQQVLASLIAGKTLVKNITFLKKWSQLDSLPPLAWYYEKSEPATDRPGTFIARLASSGAIKAGYNPDDASADASNTALLWVAPLKSVALSGVQCFPEQQTELCFIQDEEHRLYGFNRNGQQIFEHKLEGPLLGNMKAIDLFRSGQICFLFNTKNKLYLIDTQGNEVGDFPISLPSPTPLTCLTADFVAEQRYGFFVADTTGNIFGYDQAGSPLPNWNPLASIDSSAVLSLFHLQRGDKDYLLTLNQKGTLNALDKHGGLHFSANLGNQQLSSPIYFQNVEPAGRIVTGDQQGFAHIINLEGTHFRLKISASTQLFNRLLFLNMTGDDRKDYMAYSNNEMDLKYYKGNDFLLSWSKKPNISIDSAFILRHQPYKWVGLLDQSQQRISIVLPDGNIHPAFPLAGTTPFYIYPAENGYYRLVVGYENSLYTYQIQDYDH